MADDQEHERRHDGDRRADEEPGGAGVGALAERVRDAPPATPARSSGAGASSARCRSWCGSSRRRRGSRGPSRPRSRSTSTAPCSRRRTGSRCRRALRLEERVAEQRHRVHADRDQRRERERLVGGAQVDAAALDQAPAHREADADRRAREQERDDAGGAADDPEAGASMPGMLRPGTFGRPQRKLGISRERAPSITRRRRTATNIPTAPQIASEPRSAPSTLAPGTKQAENASTRCVEREEVRRGAPATTARR